MPVRKGIRAYEKFHGKRTRTVKRSSFYVPSTFVLLGDAIEIVYRCSKINGGGDGKSADYKHKFSPGTKLYMDERAGKVLYISGARLRVNRRGIVG